MRLEMPDPPFDDPEFLQNNPCADFKILTDPLGIGHLGSIGLTSIIADANI